jgi:hypothetical protein
VSWRALRGADGTARRIGAAPEGVLSQGTLTLECDGAVLRRTFGPVLRVEPGQEPQRIFAIDRRRDGDLSLLLRNGPAASHLSVTVPDTSVDGPLHLTYRWRCETGDSLLTVGNGATRTARYGGNGPVPAITGQQIAAIFTSRHGATRHPAITGIAFADHLLPLGPLPGLLAGTVVTTPDGPRSVETLRPGDMVLTAERGWQPLRWQGGIELPALPGFAPIRLRAPYHGLDRDLVVLPDQPIALAGRDIEYQFGTERVLVAARDLVDGRRVLTEPVRVTTLHCHALLLDRPEVVHASGGWVQSLNLGHIAQHPRRAALSVCGDLFRAGQMPLHAKSAFRLLHGFEVAALKHMQEGRRAPFAV